jgi:hypothetical protein
MAVDWELKRAEREVTKAQAEVERLTQQRIAVEAHGLTRNARVVSRHLLKARDRLVSAIASLEKSRQSS